MSNPQHNGRVFFEQNYPQYNLFTGGDNNNNSNNNSNNNNNNNNNNNGISESISHTQEATPLSQQYFSSRNLNLVQNNIIQTIRLKGFDIGRQDDLQVQIIMRSIFLSFSKNLYQDIQQQINKLNEMVVEEAVKKIIPEIKQYIQYIKDISTPRHIISHSQHISSKTQLGGFDMTIPKPE
jgi:hypothetical protein